MPLEQPRPAVVLKNLALKRPLAIIDLETTGRDVKEDRIVEISVLRIQPDGTTEHRTRRCHPGRPIPAEASEVHGIYDDDVSEQPAFYRMARSLHEFITGCDLCGYNLLKFDLPLLRAEFTRSKIPFELRGRAVIDVMTIFHRKERRDLSAAVGFFLNREHNKAHSSLADVLATAQVLDAMLDKYTDLPRDVEALEQLDAPGERIGSCGLLTKHQGTIRFVDRKHRGSTLEFVLMNHRSYLT